MAVDQRFYRTAQPLSLTEVLSRIGGEAEGNHDAVFVGVAALDSASATEISFCESTRYAEALRRTAAGAVLVAPSLHKYVPTSCVAILCDEPAVQFAHLAASFHSVGHTLDGVHPLSVLAPTASIGEGCKIGPFAVVGDQAQLGRGCSIGVHAHVGAGVILGEECIVHSHATISHAVCGRRVVLFPGARVGQEGFGFAVNKLGRFVTAPQLGMVELGDDVHIGANTCVDRGGLGNTVIGQGTRIDNLVQVGHNVRLGQGCILVAQVGISGSTIMEDYVTAGGQSGFAGHLTIGKGSRIAAQSGIMENVLPGTEMFGSPGRPIREAVRSLHVLRKLTAESRHVKKREAE